MMGRTTKAGSDRAMTAVRSAALHRRCKPIATIERTTAAASTAHHAAPREFDQESIPRTNQISSTPAAHAEEAHAICRTATPRPSARERAKCVSSTASTPPTKIPLPTAIDSEYRRGCVDPTTISSTGGPIARTSERLSRSPAPVFRKDARRDEVYGCPLQLKPEVGFSAGPLLQAPAKALPCLLLCAAHA
jgi:hypothetical protein